MSSKLRLLVLFAFCLATTTVGCPCVRGAVNASPGLRWWLFSTFGASKVCPAMLSRGAPLKLGQGSAQGMAPSVGRFFPEQCAVQVNEQTQTMTVSLSGTGYAMLPVARRIGFSCAVSVEYAPDFLIAEDDSLYVFGQVRRLLAPPDLRIVGVENPVINLATETPVGTVATAIAQGIVAGEIGRGFTVVREADGDGFVIGHLAPPQKPPRYFKPGAGRSLVTADVTQVEAVSREFIGPFEVPTQDQSIVLRTRTDAPLTYVVVDRASGDAWRRAYESALPLGAPFANPLMRGSLPPSEGETVLPLGPGQYFIVVENPSQPFLGGLGMGLGGKTASLWYSVELGAR